MAKLVMLGPPLGTHVPNEKWHLGRPSGLWDGRPKLLKLVFDFFELIFVFFDEIEDRIPFIYVLMHVMLHDMHPMIYFS